MQIFQENRFNGIDVNNILEKSITTGIKHIKYGEFTEEENIRFRELIKTSKKIYIMAFNAGSFVRVFSEELKIFFKNPNSIAKVILATPNSEFYDENTQLVSKKFHKNNNDTLEIENSILRLESYNSEINSNDKLEIRHFNTQLRNPLFIFDEEICHLTICIPPVESFKSITIEFNRNHDNSFVDKCVNHFDNVWQVSKPKQFWKK